MTLHVTGDRLAGNDQACAAKIRPAQKIPGAGRADLELAAVGQYRPAVVEVAPQPDFLHHALGDGERAVEALHFGNVIAIVGHDSGKPAAWPRDELCKRDA